MPEVLTAEVPVVDTVIPAASSLAVEEVVLDRQEQLRQFFGIGAGHTIEVSDHAHEIVVIIPDRGEIQNHAKTGLHLAYTEGSETVTVSRVAGQEEFKWHPRDEKISVPLEEAHAHIRTALLQLEKLINWGDELSLEWR